MPIRLSPIIYIISIMAIIILAGCVNPVGQQNLSFKATPVGVNQTVLADTGYSSQSSQWRNSSRNISVASQQKTLELANYVTEYRRTLGNGSEAGFGIFATPKAEFAGQELNPINEWSEKRIIRDIPNPYGSVRDLNEQNTRSINLLGTETQATIFAGTSESGTDVLVYLARVEHEGDIIVAGAVHSTEFNESSRIIQLFRGVQHPPSTAFGTADPNRTISVTELNKKDGEYIGQRVRVKGYYSQRSIPMLVADYREVVTNEPLPRHSYVPINTATSDRELTSEQEGYTLIVEGIVREQPHETPQSNTDTTGWGDNTNLKADVGIVKSNIRIEVKSVEILELDPNVSKYITKTPNEFIRPSSKTSKRDCRFAVILSGGINKANNHDRYWDGVVQTYQAMNGSFNIPDDQIYVNYFHGAGKTPVNGKQIVDGSAKQSSIDSTFTSLKTEFNRCQNSKNNEIKSEVMIFTYNHGTFNQGKNLIGTQILSPNELHDYLVELRLAGGDEINIMMMQCYSGHFINLTSGLSGRSTKGTVDAIATSTRNDEVSYGKEFGWDFVAALAGSYPNGTTVRADKNNDGNISWKEAFIYAKKHDKWGPNGTGHEHPQFFSNSRWRDPDGDGIHTNFD